MNCPKCKTIPLKQGTVKFKGVEIDFCPGCKGMWFDRTDAGDISEAAIKDLQVPAFASPTDFLCPKCNRSLYAFDYPQTVAEIDMCKRCQGFWLDAGEWKEIEAVRKAAKEKGNLQEYAEPSGIKGTVIQFIDRTIDWLRFSDVQSKDLSPWS